MPAPPDRSAAFAALAAELQSTPDEGVTARAIVGRFLDLVADAEYVSLTVRQRRSSHVTLASTDKVAQSADDLQYELDEGPCVQASDDEASAWIRSSDVTTDRRFPRWGPVAGQLGIGSLLSVQLLTKGEPTGALNLYSSETGRFGDRETVDLALVYAVHAANALSAARLATGLQTAMSSRHVIGVALGIVMERYGLTESAGFELLRRISSTENVRLRDVAAGIVGTRVVPTVGAGGSD